MTTLCCPSCGSPLAGGDVPPAALLDLPLGGQRRILLAQLVAAYPKPVTVSRLIHELYSDRIDGGPDRPANVISVHLVRLRQMIEPYGWTIPRMRAGGLGGQSPRRLARHIRAEAAE